MSTFEKCSMYKIHVKQGYKPTLTHRFQAIISQLVPILWLATKIFLYMLKT